MKVDKQTNPYNELKRVSVGKQTKQQRIYSFGEQSAEEYPIKNTVGDSSTVLGSKSASSKPAVYDKFTKTNPIT